MENSKHGQLSSVIIILGLFYISFIIISNFIGGKVLDISGFNVPASIIFYPLTYIIDVIVTEIYGFKTSRKIIWSGFVVNLVIVLGCWLAIYLPSASFWKYQESYQTVFSQSPRILFASLLSCFSGEFLNSIILSKLKVKTSGQFFFLRALFSSSIAIIIDSFIFCSIVFYSEVPFELLIKIIITQCIFKILYEILLLPIVSQLVSYLKLRENMDVYDYNAIYNPFRI